MISNEYNSMKLHFHLDKVSAFQEGVNISPVTIECNITNKCNINCRWCSEKSYRNERIKDQVEKEPMIKSIKEMAEVGVRSIVFEGGGEPTTHKNLIDFAKAAYVSGLNVGLITNGINLDSVISNLKLFHFVRVSLDSGNAESYKRIKDSNKFDTVISNIRKIASEKKKKRLDVVLGSSFIVTEDNIDSIENYAAICKNRRIDYIQFKPEIFNNTFKYVPGAEVLLKKIKEKYEDDLFAVFLSRFNGEACLNKKDYNYCYAHRFIGAITANGKVQLCCNLKHENGDDYSFGSIYDKGFKNIWESLEREDLLFKVERDQMFIKKCGQCRMDQINRYLNFIKTKNNNYLKNFI